ncbi:MAG: thiolase family protein [Gemmatimonadetes bacterium]|nr:thiolase family protein [Gemmatimonadota bacterium]
MRFERAAIPLRHLWSSPFVRWQGALADVSSLDLAHAVTRDALAQRQVDRGRVTQLVLGTTIPQQGSFYAAPWLAARLGMQGISGPHIAQACATSAACLMAAARSADENPSTCSLVVATDRTSNGPLLVYPRGKAMGGSPATENWVLDNFAADPWTGQSMLHTAEAVAREGGMTRAQLDELTLLRYRQYAQALADNRAFQRRFMQPVVLQQGRKELRVEADEGVHATTAEGLAALKPAMEGGVITAGAQTHPADGCAGAVLMDADTARAAAAGEGIVRLLVATTARVEKARMPKAATVAAEKALHEAALSMADIAVVTTHNPFAANDQWLAQQTGCALEKMNPFGCSMVWGHPQGPTGLRAIAELAHALQLRGGGIGLFTGCAAGDTGAALVLRVE